MIVINTKTLKDFIEVVEWFFDKGLRWRNGDKFVHEEYWDSYRNKTCIIGYEDIMTYCDCSYVLETYDTKILDMERFHKHTNRKYLSNMFGMKYDLK